MVSGRQPQYSKGPVSTGGKLQNSQQRYSGEMEPSSSALQRGEDPPEMGWRCKPISLSLNRQAQCNKLEDSGTFS